MSLDKEEIIKSGNRLGWIILTIITVIVIIFTIITISIYKMFTPPTPRKYYILDVNDKNKKEVIKLFEEEKENIFGTEDYCDSIYKIEFYIGFFSDIIDYTIYCKNEDNISFDIDSLDADNLSKYIRENGYTEKR